MFTTAFELRSSMLVRKRHGTNDAPSGALKKACAAPVEDVTDELRDLLATESLADAGLPRFGLFLPPHGSERAILRSFTRTLAILARRRGTLFLRDAEPIVWSAVDGEVLDLWTPADGSRERDMNARCDSAALAARIYSSFPVAQSAFARLLHLLDIEATDSVPTAAVTLGDRSRLLLNPKFVAENCPADHDLVMLVLHELHHVALGHTRLFPRLTPAQNWAFDCVINAQLCRLYPEPHHTALFRRYYRADAMPQALLRPPEGWRTRQVRWLPGRAGDMHRALYSDESVTYADLYQLLPALAAADEDGFGLAPQHLLGDHTGAGERSDIAPDVLREMRNILAEWPMVERIAGRDQGGDAKSSHIEFAQALRQAAATLRKAILAIADLGVGQRGAIERRDEERDGMLPYALRPRPGRFRAPGAGRAIALASGAAHGGRDRAARSSARLPRRVGQHGRRAAGTVRHAGVAVGPAAPESASVQHAHRRHRPAAACARGACHHRRHQHCAGHAARA